MYEKLPPSLYADPNFIEVRGAKVHNLKDVALDIPLRRLVGIAGVSGSGKSSLALGVLYAEGSRRYLEALSTYTRRRIGQVSKSDTEEVRHVPAALALRQRPGVPDVRSTFGTSTEVLNHLRLMFSRLASHRCPNGHYVPPTMNVALERPITCPECGVEFYGPGAEDLAFNSGGACEHCGGTGVVRAVDEATLVQNPDLTIDEGAVVPWKSFMFGLMPQVVREMGVRTDVPYKDLTDKEKDIVMHGPMEKRHILYVAKNKSDAAELDFTYYNAVKTIENSLAKAKDEKGLARVAKYLTEEVCPACHGTRLSEKARAPKINGLNLADVTAFTLDELRQWLPTVREWEPEEMRKMTDSITSELKEPLERLAQLGLGYLSFDRASSTLSNGERQRVALTRAVRSRTTGVLYVLDEPSIGMHPSNVEGLLGVMDDLLQDGNSVVFVDHDIQVLRHAQEIIEIGPGSGDAGGRVVAQGTPEEVAADPESRVGPFLSGARQVRVRRPVSAKDLFSLGAIKLESGPLHTVQDLTVSFPLGRLSAVTGVSGSGKTTLVLESLIPALSARLAGTPLPAHVKDVDTGSIERVALVDATPIGVNVRSTVATYSGVLDDLRKLFADTPQAKADGLTASDFSYNTGSLRCPVCDGTGSVSLDVQFLPDVDVPCPECRGTRYAAKASDYRLHMGKDDHCEDLALPEVLERTVSDLLPLAADYPRLKRRLKTLEELGLGYLTLGEDTPALSGGEAQRLKLAGEMHRSQKGTLFVFDEPTIGLHPLDVETLLKVLQKLVDKGATVLVIEHDLDMIANADYVVDMGPGGGLDGGRIVASGTPEEVAASPASITGRYLKAEIEQSRDA
ncbi:MAG: excinuclease ABC subunit UvrA [Clostridia bacterium]|nr:excinuclease ABC subunit UvrA [Clostridia bacterium]